jgi:hypothetical protein
MRSLVQPMSGQVEQSADAIIAGTTDPKVQMAALRRSPRDPRCALSPDPAVAALDTAVLCNQMIDYFEIGHFLQAVQGENSPLKRPETPQIRKVSHSTDIGRSEN